MAIAAAAGLLTCPHCGQALALTDAGARCGNGHTWDLARQGYLNLLAGPQPRNADTAAMLGARARVLDSGLFDPLLDLVAGHARPARRILEVGAGTAHYLRRALGDDPAAAGVALDVSVPAARTAARADPRIASVVADTWRGLPVRDHSLDAVLSVFAPRNLAEFARVLVTGGRLLVLAPNDGHLAGLRERYGLLAIETGKQDRLLAAASEFFDVRATSRVRVGVTLTAGQAGDLIAMGPNAFHDPPVPAGPLGDHLDVTLRVFEPLPAVVSGPVG